MKFPDIDKLSSQHGDIKAVRARHPQEIVDAIAEVVKAQHSNVEGFETRIKVAESKRSLKTADGITDAVVPPTSSVSSRYSFSGSFTYLPLCCISLFYFEFGPGTVVEFESTAPYYLAKQVLSGSMAMEHAAFRGEIKAGEGCLLLPGQYTRIEMISHFRCIAVAIDMDVLEDQLAQVIGMPVANGINFEIPMDLKNGSVASWWRLIEFVESEFKHAHSLFVDGSGVQDLERTLITNLLSCQPHQYSDHLSGRGPVVAPVHVRRAEVFIQANARSDIGLADIVEASGVARRTLYDAFKRFRGITPMNLLKNVRLDGAYDELSRPEVRKSITDVALGWGFKHTGRFSMAYKKRYGESPSATLQGDP